MNKKIQFLLVILVVIVIVICAVVQNKTEETGTNPLVKPSVSGNTNNEKDEKTVEVTDLDRINKIKEESYLNILVQVKSFDSLNVSYEPLLEAAMRIARELDLYEVPENGTYIEYVPRATVHQLIYELSGIKIADPIIIEDFYYLYDSAGDYYYIVPIGSDWLELKEIHSISVTSTSEQYAISCSAESITDYDFKTVYPDIKLRVKYKPTNTYIKYQLISIDAGKSQVEEIQIFNNASGENV